jgi:hypothetical protein
MNLLAKYINFCHVRAKRAKNVPAFSFATVQSLNLPDRQAIRSNHHANNYRCQQMMNCQYITMSVNGAGSICGVESPVIELLLSRRYA